MGKLIVVINLFIFLFSASMSSQDLEKVGKEKPIKINGGIGLNYTTTKTSDSNRIPMPAFWAATLNLNANIYDLSIPITAVFTNGQFNLNHSFNQFGLSPHYKWITVHAGHRQYSYSPYTVSGQTFFGGGVDLTPPYIRLSCFGGRLRNASQIDTTSALQQTIPGSYPVDITTVNGVNNYSKQPAFARWGWGGKIGFGKQSNFVDFIFFKGYDDAKSLTNNNAANLYPEENVVLGINIFQRFLKHFSLGANAATSAYTYNTTANPLTLDFPLGDVISNIITVGPTTQVQWAGEANASITYPSFSLVGSYKRIEPHYKSMGISSSISDISAFSLQPSWSLFKNRVRFSNMFQHQTDNLNDFKVYTTKRLMANSSVSLNLTNAFGIDLSYNHFGSTQSKNTPTTTDSINSSQKSNSYTLSPHYFFSTTTVSDVVSFVGSYTLMENRFSLMNSDVKNIYATINNTLMFFKGGWSINTGLNINSSKTTTSNLLSYGFIVGLSKSLINNQITLTNNNTILWNQLNGSDNGKTFSSDINAAYNFLLHNSLSFNFNYLYSPANEIYNINDFNQTRITLSYQYNF